VPIEAKRQCGWRKVGAMYLVGSGIATPCDLLPLPIEPCPTCGFTLPFTRGFIWIHRNYVLHRRIVIDPSFNKLGLGRPKDCSCPANCPICFPSSIEQEKVMLLWVGSRYYTPDSFVKEAQEMGVSKRIADIPKGLKLGSTWVLLAHKKVPFQRPIIPVERATESYEPTIFLKTEPIYKPAVFYAFKPTKIEMLIWQRDTAPQRLEELKKKNITPIIVPDNEKEHA